MIKAVIFDCFGVLVKPAFGTIFTDFPDRAEDTRNLINKSNSGELLHQQYIQAMAQNLHLTVEETLNRYWRNKQRDEATITWVKNLHASGTVKVGLLSNVGQNWIDDFLPEAERNQMFDKVILSYQVGMIKPFPSIYQLMAQRLNLSPEDCLMIDDVEENIVGASKAGMKGIVYKNDVQAQAELQALLEEVHA